MKKYLLLFHFSILILNSAFSQNPLVKMWDKRYGGDEYDQLICFEKTNDGGYILCGWSFSGIGGDKTQNSRDTSSNLQYLGDFWIVKIDAAGNIQWDRDFGGYSVDWLTAMLQTRDGGYLLGGYSLSGIGGDKTEDTLGNFDYWVVKIDSLGNKEWDKSFGGTEEDKLYSMIQTPDGGFLLGGNSGSPISGNKTENTFGLFDYWLVKIDSLGNKIWDKDYGGNQWDYLTSICATSDSCFILAGSSSSGISGNKTQANWGIYDFWIIKIDSLGNMVWDNDFGGTDFEWFPTIEQVADKGFILGGSSGSGIGGNKTQSLYGGMDNWILKIDSSGNLLWDADYGGNLEEELGQIVLSGDKGFLISGDSYSPISGNKTENNLGSEQTWIVKTDSSGAIQWEKTLFTTGHDENGLAIEIENGCYIFANSDDGGIGGYRSQSTRGNYDYWITKFCDSTLTLPIASANAAQVLCPGTCTDFLNLSQNAASYQWSFPGAIPDTSTSTSPTNICYSTSGIYDVQLIATNANGSDTLLLTNYITVFPSPPAQSISQSGDTLFAIAGSNSYQWYYNGNLIIGATDYFYIAPSSGDYNVIVADTNGCEVEAVINNVLAGFSPLSFGEGSAVRLYPNPVVSELIIKNERIRIETAVTISIYNLLGDLAVQPQTLNFKPETSIVVSALPKGMYWLELNSGERFYRTKFVKQ